MDDDDEIIMLSLSVGFGGIAAAGQSGVGTAAKLLSPEPASVPLARHFFADWLEHLAIDTDDIADLLLVASELCANAVHHGRGTTNSLVLRAWAEGNDIVLQAEDDGSGFDPPQRYEDELPDPEAVAGRGLFLIQSLSDGVRVERSDNRTIVQVRKDAILSTPS